MCKLFWTAWNEPWAFVALCIGIAFTYTSLQPKFPLSKDTAEPRSAEHAIIIGAKDMAKGSNPCRLDTG